MSEVVANRRIDAGIKRGPRKQIDRRPKAALAQARNGQLISQHSPELKAQVIKECQELIAVGYTPAEIALRHGIPPRTVQYWLLGDETAEKARGQLIASELARTLDDMRKPTDAADDSPLRLARAREEFRAWSWIAERREARLYGQKQEVQHTVVAPTLQITVVSAQHAAPLQPESAPAIIDHDTQVVDK